MNTLRLPGSTVARLVVAFVMGTLLVASASTPVHAATPTVMQLAVTKYSQERAQWCWAAAAQTVIRFRTGKVQPQCTLFKEALGRSQTSTCSTSDGNIADNPATNYPRTRALLDKHLGKGQYTYKNSITWAQVKKNIDSGYPVIATIRFYQENKLSKPTWQLGPSRHLVTIYGYRVNANGTKFISFSNAPQLSASNMSTTDGGYVRVATGVQPSAKAVEMTWSKFTSTKGKKADGYYKAEGRIAKY